MWSAVRPACSGGHEEQVCRQAGIPLLVESSIKRALDIDWNDAVEKTAAITTFSRQLDALQSWIARQLPEELAQPPLKAHVETLVQIRTQDLEPDPRGGGSRIREGVAEDRRVSIADQEMRHGRKSKSKRFNGFKRHIAADVDRGLILACAITPANRPEEEAMPSLTVDLARQGLDVDHLLIDRGYINSTLVDEVLAGAARSCANPGSRATASCFPSRRSRSISATARSRARMATCNGFSFGTVVEFDPDSAIAARCARNAPPRSSATGAPSPSRRTSRCSSGCASRSRRPRDAPRCGAHDDRAQARAYFATTRQPRALRRCPQEHLRPPPRERHPESGDTPSLRVESRKAA